MRLSFMGLLGCILAAGIVLLKIAPRDEENAKEKLEFDLVAQGGVTPPFSSSRVLGEGAQSERHPHNTAPPAGESRVAAAYTGDAPMALAVEFRNSGGRGGFSTAAKIIEYCREALGALAMANDATHAAAVDKSISKNQKNSSNNQAFYAISKQILEARCRQFQGELSIEEPLASDVDGIEYVRLQKIIIRRDGEARKAIQQLARVDYLYNMVPALISFRHFDGVDFNSQEDIELLQRAMSIAEIRLTTDQGRVDRDLRLMIACLNYAACNGDVENAMLQKWEVGSSQRLKAVELSRRIESAFRANNVDAFLPR